MSKVVLTRDNFADYVREDGGLAVIDFYAAWCAPCRMISPVLDEVADMTDVYICKCSVDDEPALADRFGIHVIPTLVFVLDGAEVWRTEGIIGKTELLLLIDRYR